ncbi:hypothetical protein F3Y22_tig00014444pilonHSYRG00122 [Hibiscus syriacus]|uniref:Uncharacterized protein n=1 Tax=Hibiscus syriacus TaxID=106335 RepID=A0A6A3BZB1_HIBSY|nr:hypothetical protein F3Y22_tig00014444pilonHSYRG00122 [Hibiscus syriacus]
MNRSQNGHLTLRELKRGNLIDAMLHADEEEDINKFLRRTLSDIVTMRLPTGLLIGYFLRFQESLPVRSKGRWGINILFTSSLQRRTSHPSLVLSTGPEYSLNAPSYTLQMKIECFTCLAMSHLQDESYVTLRDLKGSKLTGSVFNILFNLNKL